MHSVSTPHIHWSDLAYGFACCLQLGSRADASRSVEETGFLGSETLACLSAPGAFDLLLDALELTAGTEVVVCPRPHSAFGEIAAAHGLRVVEVGPDSGGIGSLPTGRLAAAMTPRTGIIIATHEFGDRIPMDEIARLATARGVLLVEHCIEAYARRGYRGHDGTHAVILSFGRVEAGVPLPGALADIRIPTQYRRMRALQREWTDASRLWCAKQLALHVLRSLWAQFRSRQEEPRTRPDNRDQARAWGPQSGRDGFADGLRRRPPYPVLRLLHRRLRRSEAGERSRRSPVVPRGALHNVWRNPLRSVGLPEIR